MSVFTVFFCGTGSNSEDHGHKNYMSGELISSLAHNAVGQEVLDYLQVDGVGSGNRSEWQKHSKDDTYAHILGELGGRGIDSNMNHVLSIMRGDEVDKANYISRSKDMLSDMKPKKKKHFWNLNVTQSYKSWMKEVEELSEDLQSALSLQRASVAAERKANPITQVNIVGWSRGGVSCFELANRMLHDPSLNHIPVNIFACDPVPGGLNAFKDYKTLGVNVKNVVCFFAEDERSMCFKARMPRVHNSTRYYTSWMPGRHATLVGNSHTSGGSKGGNVLTGPGTITRDFMEKVLVGWGTRLENKKLMNLSRSAILGFYAQIKTNKDHYEAMHGQIYTVKNRLLWGSGNRIGQKRETWHGIPIKRMEYPGIYQDYGDAVNRHHSDVINNDIFAIKGLPRSLAINS
ncbi:hypothetical protein N9R79_05185 [Vibrio sp.]|nr:hypothetical protein [Vibrio sp.]